MTKITFTNTCGTPIEICNSLGYALKKLNNKEKYSFTTTKHGMPLYFKRVSDNQVTDNYKYYNGQFVIDSQGIRSANGVNRYKVWRDSHWSLDTVKKVIDIGKTVLIKK